MAKEFSKMPIYIIKWLKMPISGHPVSNISKINLCSFDKIGETETLSVQFLLIFTQDDIFSLKCPPPLECMQAASSKANKILDKQVTTFNQQASY